MTQPLTSYTLSIFSIANTPDDLNYFVVQEATLPQFTRIVLEVPVDPSLDIESIAQQVETACSQNNVPYWPENQGTYTAVDGNTLYIEYMRPYSGPSPMQLQILPILLIIGIIAPIIMYFAVPGFAQLVNSIVMLLVMVVMMKLMMPIMSSISAPSGQKAVSAPPTPQEKKPPIEQRIASRIESIADAVARIESVFRRSKAEGLDKASRITSDIERLEKYESNLTPTQLEKLEEERRIIEQVREMYA